MSKTVASNVILNKSETNPIAVLRKATKYLSAEFGDVSECEVEIGTNWKM
jgi:hypothetical protein